MLTYLLKIDVTEMEDDRFQINFAHQNSSIDEATEGEITLGNHIHEQCMEILQEMGLQALLDGGSSDLGHLKTTLE